MSKPKDQCISRNCGNPRLCRGLCVACYHEARRRIIAKKTTEAELVRRKMILPVNRTGRPSKNKLAKQLMSAGK